MGKDGGLAEVISSGSKEQRVVEVNEGVEGLWRRRGERYEEKARMQWEVGRGLRRK